MQTCSACTHSKRAEIDSALVAGVPSLRNIAKQFGLSVSALFRHKDHLAQALTLAKEAGEIAHADTLLARVKEVISKAEVIADRALEAKEFSAAARGIAEIRQCLELLGELSGALQHGAAAVNVGIAVGLSEQDQQDLERGRLNRILSHETHEELDARAARLGFKIVELPLPPELLLEGE